MADKVYEMLWDCKFCGTTKLLGKTHRHCPGCGAPQDPNTRYFPSDDEKVAVEDHIYVGADQICPSCQGLNVASAEFCTTCGAPLSEAARARTLESQSRAEGEKFESSGSRDLTKEQFEAEMLRVGVRKPPAAGRGMNPLIPIALIGFIGLLVVGALVALFWTRETVLVATGHSWAREVTIEDFAARPGTAWRDGLPADAYNLSCRVEQRSVNRIPDGQDCRTVRVDRGDGTFTERQECTTRYREEPVYDERCTYLVNRWAFSHTLAAEGQGLSPEPYWPEVTDLQCPGQARLGCQREGGRNAQYLVHFSGDEGRQYQCPFEQSVWQSVPIESVWGAQVRVVDAGAVDCGSLERRD